MTSRDFCFWLQGYLEINGHAPSTGVDESLQPKQVECIRQHLGLVFKHEIDPAMGPPKHQAALDAIHSGPTYGPGGPVMRC